jgi:hypothetical protein
MTFPYGLWRAQRMWTTTGWQQNGALGADWGLIEIGPWTAATACICRLDERRLLRRPLAPLLQRPVGHRRHQQPLQPSGRRHLLARTWLISSLFNNNFPAFWNGVIAQLNAS